MGKQIDIGRLLTNLPLFRQLRENEIVSLAAGTREIGLAKGEPPRVYRRRFCLSQAVSADSFNWRWYAISDSAGGTLPIGSSNRRLLNQSTHCKVADSTASRPRHGPR
jgi:hypothetical protein